jgi:putative nucleotidyltransferase with HDIG domain
MKSSPSSEQLWAVVSDTKPAMCEALERVFGTSFELFSSDSDDADLVEIACQIGQRRDHPAGGFSSPCSSHDIRQHVAIPDGAVFCLPDRRVVLTVPIEGNEQRISVAAAIIPPAAPELIRSCVSAAFELCAAKNNVKQYGNRLTSYAEQLSDCYEELVWLRDLGQQITHCRVNRSTGDVGNLILAELRELIRAETVAFVQLKQSSTVCELIPMTVNSLCGNADLVDGERNQLLGRYLADNVQLCRGLPLVQNSRNQTTAIAGLPEVHSMIVVPVSVDDINYGWIVALNRCLHLGMGHTNQIDVLGADEFGTVEATLVQTAATMLATHGQNSQLFHDKEELMLDVVKSLVRSLEARDDYTCGHSDRVAIMSRIIAEELGLESEALKQIYIAGLLHDIGKVGIPDGVLNKPGRLTDDEFAMIKQHPVIGYDILKNLRQFEFVLPAVRHHHEQMDGRGYPDALAGEAIPLEARIMAVADAYDAMTSNRPYRDGMPTEKAESILRENRGPQWDPQVLDAFFRRRDEIRIFCRDHKSSSIMHHLTGDKQADT